ncbi:MAG: SGNH hydrolase domain-containing protein, partial [Hyphomicrobium sp.]
SQSFDVAPAVARHVAWGTPLPAALGVAQFKDDEGVVLSILARLATIPHVRVVYPHLSLCDANVCRYSVDGKPMYSDNDHLSPTGVATLSGMFDEIFAADTTPQAASVKTSR